MPAAPATTPPSITVASHDDALVHLTVTDGDQQHSLRLSTDVAVALAGQLLSAAHVALTHPATFPAEVAAKRPFAPAADDETPRATPLPLHHSGSHVDGADAAEPSAAETDGEEQTAPPVRTAGGVTIPEKYRSLIESDVSDGKPWRLTVAATASAQKAGVTPEEMIAAAEHPEQIRATKKPEVSNHLLGDVSVLVPADGDHVIIGTRREYAAAETSGRATAPSGGPGKAVPTTTAELVDALRRHGFTVVRRAGTSHLKVTHPDRPEISYSIASTPSDNRAFRNAVSQVRTMFDIDVTSTP